MLRIKLVPTGKRNFKQYRIVVQEDREKLTGNIVEHLGSFNPHVPTENLIIDKISYESWIKKGAQPTKTVKSLVNKVK
jgi:small subunit ribosomal protein S16